MKTLLGEIRQLFETALRGVARLCATDGQGATLDSHKLDALQPLCYELALAGAELLAGETAVETTEAASGMEQSLAHLFASDAATAVLARLETVFLDAGLDTAALHAVLTGTRLAAHSIAVLINRQCSS